MLKGPTDFTLPGSKGGAPNNIVPLGAVADTNGKRGLGPFPGYPVQ